MIRSVVRGVGSYLPARIVTNDELALSVDTDDVWIRERTGIAQRHIAAPDELTSDLATAAARSALDAADLDPASIDLLIVATSTPDNTFPATATAVQRKLGLDACIAFDLQAVCAGFPFALATADAYLKSGMARRAMVIGAETFSRLLDWTDRTTCVLFGDGAGALVVSAEQVSAPDAPGILANKLAADGRSYDHLYVDGGPSSNRSTGYLRMNGREVFRQAVAKLSDAALEVLELADHTIDDVDLLVPHQANKRIIDGVGKRLGIDEGRVVVTVDRHANTSAASIPLALHWAVQNDRLHRGDLVLTSALGGGFAWGANLLRW